MAMVHSNVLPNVSLEELHEAKHQGVVGMAVAQRLEDKVNGHMISIRSGRDPCGTMCSKLVSSPAQAPSNHHGSSRRGCKCTAEATGRSKCLTQMADNGLINIGFWQGP